MTEPTAGSGTEAEPVPTAVVIDRLGAHGDGVADTADGPRFVPFALPGETWSVGAPSMSGAADRTAPELAAALAGAPSPDRATPVCRHFGTCGGCAAQHMAPGLYARWKRGIVVEAFRQRGLAPEIGPLVTVAARSRRRATFTARRIAADGTRTGRAESGVHLGYHGRASHTLVDIAACPVLEPRIEAALPGLRAICGLVLPRLGKSGAGGRTAEARLQVTLARGGLDVAITIERPAGGRGGPRRALDGTDFQAVIGHAQRRGIQRLTLDGEPILAGAAPVVSLGGIDVVLPDTAFLQAVAEAETAITALVLDGVGKLEPKTARVADLFCGLGTFTFALAAKSRVLALDGDAAAIGALGEAARHARGLKPIEARRRDLFREPLAARELAGLAAAVLDPPRAGAAAQAAALAASQVPRVVMVSCNPATLARDVRTLVDGGYHLAQVTPIDQFVYAPHVEVVAVLSR